MPISCDLYAFLQVRVCFHHVVIDFLFAIQIDRRKG